MPKLDNPKHEAFAGHLARGLSQTKAYSQAGYNQNPAGASRLAASPAVIARVEELKKEVAQKIQVAMKNPSEKTFGDLADMGLTMEWVAESFKNIYEKALAAGKFDPANTAVSNIQKLLELEGKAKENEEDADAPKLNIKDVNRLLENTADVIRAARENPGPEMIDVTPEEKQ